MLRRRRREIASAFAARLTSSMQCSRLLTLGPPHRPGRGLRSRKRYRNMTPAQERADGFLRPTATSLLMFNVRLAVGL